MPAASKAEPHRYARTRVLRAPVDVVDMDGAVQRLIEMVEDHRRHPDAQPKLVVTLNPEMVMRARRDRRFRAALESAAMLVPDGIGVVRAVRRRGFPLAVRVGGTDMLAAYLPHAVARGHRIALAGSAPGVGAMAARRLVRAHPGLQIVAVDAGAPGPELAERLRAASPDVVWSAYGAGRQEFFVTDHLAASGAAVGIGVGGALDYFSGRTRRAPALWREAGVEWVWRLLVEPRRLRRQLVLPAFWWMERREASRSRPC
jgi:N-acetylglucosaminyldiphosphoundecaprenol N-acetyl-beta-D-mannosaminyltransferase